MNKKEISKLLNQIKETSYTLCYSYDKEIAAKASKINNDAFLALKLLNQVPEQRNVNKT